MHYPSAELVAVAWAKAIGGEVPLAVATTLPSDNSSWAASGFIRATVLAANSAYNVPLHTPVVRFDCWACDPSSNKAPWGQATGLAHALLHATYARTVPALVLPAGFYPARLLSVYPVGGPMRIPGDEAGFARVAVDIALSWTTTAEVAA